MIDLDVEFNKHIPIETNGRNINNIIQPVPTQQIKQELDYMISTLENQGQVATNASSMHQGITDNNNASATEISLSAQNGNSRFNLTSNIFAWSEKKFWEQWYKLYKIYFKKGIDEKILRIANQRNRTLMRDNLIANIDPDVQITNKRITENQKQIELQKWSNFLQIASAVPDIDTREIVRKIAQVSDLDDNEISFIIPENIDEMKANKENEFLDKDKQQKVDRDDDDIQHLRVHRKANPTEALKIHLETHKKNLLMKKEKNVNSGMQQGEMEAEAKKLSVPQYAPNYVDDGKSKIGKVI